MNDEMKVRSFRISDSVAEKFKAFGGEFDNQNAALNNLIATYEMQNAKSVLMDRKTDTPEKVNVYESANNRFMNFQAF